MVGQTEHQSPPAAVIVPVYNAAATLADCLKALARQTVPRQGYEIIVVDDGSSDGSGQIAAGYEVQTIRQAHAGAAAARNRGVAATQAEILLFTDADCEPLPDWIEQMLAPLADPTVAGVKGIYRTRQRSLVARFTQAELEEKYDRLARAGQIDFVDTYAAAYRRDLFQALGGFDPGIALAEDQEFSFRVARAGHRLVFAPAAAVYHRHLTTLGGYLRRKAGIGRWKVTVHARHPAKAVRDSYTPWTQKAQVVLPPLFGAALLLALLGLIPWPVPAVVAGLGLLSIVPLSRKAARQGWRVLALTPAMSLLRALALEVGIALGCWDLVRALARNQ
jgi:cellulose synthase/poly-beta-1,6-N-acetylglucosamine synthase-like glycosyltransferase